MDFIVNNVFGAIILFVVGTVIPLVFASFLPNEKFRNWGFKVGSLMSQKGKKILGPGYETAENNLTGSFVSFAQGLQAGADSDDAKIGREDTRRGN